MSQVTSLQICLSFKVRLYARRVEITDARSCFHARHFTVVRHQEINVLKPVLRHVSPGWLRLLRHCKQQ